MFQTSATASKRLRIEPKSCILMQHFEAACVRKVLIVKHLEHAQNILRVVPRERRKIVLSVPYILKIMSRSLSTRNRVANFCDKYPKSKIANYFLDGVFVSGPTA